MWHTYGHDEDKALNEPTGSKKNNLRILTVKGSFSNGSVIGRNNGFR
jgi:hypothetical protein